MAILDLQMADGSALCGVGARLYERDDAGYPGGHDLRFGFTTELGSDANKSFTVRVSAKGYAKGSPYEGQWRDYEATVPAAQCNELRSHVGGRTAWGVPLSLVGALPFTLSGQIPFYLDAVFEMISGFTTTGSSILPAVESLDRCMLFWRSLSHWIGGMGILVFMLAIVRMDGGQAIHLLRAESPGPTVSKMVPRMVDSSKILYGIYFGLTVVQIILYLAGGHGRLRHQKRLLRLLQRLHADGHDGLHGAVRREFLDLFLPAAQKI